MARCGLWCTSSGFVRFAFNAMGVHHITWCCAGVVNPLIDTYRRDKGE